MSFRLTEEQYRALAGGKHAASSKPTKGVATDSYSSNKKGWRDFSGDRRYYLRSLWEINYAHFLEWLYLNNSIQYWEYETEVFTFPKEPYKTGPFSYKPDFKVTSLDGSVEWHEVKGWLNNSSKKKIARFRKHFPEEKLIIIDKTIYYRDIHPKKRFIPHWEYL